jgi:hypothetical protein
MYSYIIYCTVYNDDDSWSDYSDTVIRHESDFDNLTREHLYSIYEQINEIHQVFVCQNVKEI